MTDTRIHDLREQLAVYQLRYPIETHAAAVNRMEASVARRHLEQIELRHQVEVLESRIRDLEAKHRRIGQEITGFERALEALIDDTLDRIRNDFGETWSHTPVLGYRAWTVEGDGLHGAKTRWTGRKLDAKCLAGGPEIDVPHAIGVCGSPPCGIYATKDLKELAAELGDHIYGYVALGFVELSGKVVEHERGYRAAHAEVVALAVAGGPGLFTACTPSEIDQLFQRSEWLLPRQCHATTLLFDHAAAYIDEQTRRHQQ